MQFLQLSLMSHRVNFLKIYFLDQCVQIFLNDEILIQRVHSNHKEISNSAAGECNSAEHGGQVTYSEPDLRSDVGFN